MFETTEHPSFRNQPTAEDKIWRYMDLARYLSFLDARALHFVRADQMADTWEGVYGPKNLELRPGLYGEDYEAVNESLRKSRAYMRQRMHMNCWHHAPVESAAMWDIYQRDGRGVAVQSTWARLTSSINDSRSVYGAKIQYVDYSQTFIPEGNAFDAFMHKRESFSHEQEVRLIAMTGLSGPHPNEEGTSVDLGPEPPVIPIRVNLEALVQAVYVAPNAPEWVGNVVESVTARYGYQFPVRQSDLGIDPID